MADDDKALLGVLVEGTLKPGATLRARAIAENILRVHRNDGRNFWGYVTAIGGGRDFVIFAPICSYAELDAPLTGPQLAKSGHPNADRVLTDIEELVQTVHRSIVEYVPALSNPPTDDAKAPGPYILHIEAQLKAGATLAARKVAEQIVAAYQKNKDAAKFWSYVNATSDGRRLHVIVPFKSYADLDSLPSTGEVLANAIGGGPADELLTELESMLESTDRRILEYVPGLSHPA